MTPRTVPLRSCIACLGLFSLAAGACTLTAQDELHLASGMVITGEIVNESPTAVIIRTQALIHHKPLSAMLTFPKDQIDNRLTVPSFPDQYAARAATTPDTVEAHLALARWCMDCCLVPEAVLNVQRADALDTYNPLVAQLFKDLGYVKDQGQWVVGDDTVAKASRADRPVAVTPPVVQVAAARPAAVSTGTAPAAATAGAAAAEADTSLPIAAQDVPPAVMAVMAKAAAGAALVEYVRDLEEGAVVFSAEFTGTDGKVMEVTVSKDAVLLDVSPEIEDPVIAGAGGAGAAAAAAAALPDVPDVSIAPRELPPAVYAAMSKAAGRNQLGDFVRAVDEGKIVFSAEFTRADGTVMEVTVAKNGDVLEVAPEAEDPAPGGR